MRKSNILRQNLACMSEEQLQTERDFIINVANRIIPVIAISPFSGGQGEKDRADMIESILREMGHDDFSRYDVTDEYGKVRSSIVLKAGNCERTLWFISHIDTVPAGNTADWKYPPFKVTEENGRLYGRGTGDNGQAVFLSLLLLKALKPEKLRFNLGLAFVADEEAGNRYGIQHLLSKNVFGKDDLFLVPDSGTSDGLDIEVAEKSIMWLRFTVKGKEYHASKPSNAINTSREGMKLLLKVDKFLHEKYDALNEVFDPPYSTFEPTKHDNNVDNVNTIPGEDIFYMDCRIIPKYDLDLIMDDLHSLIREFEKESPARVKIEAVQKEQAPLATRTDSEVYGVLAEAIKQSTGKEPRAVGIGGGTCAKFFREKGLDAVVWSTADDEVYHKVDEYCVIDYIFKDREIVEKIIYGN